MKKITLAKGLTLLHSTFRPGRPLDPVMTQAYERVLLNDLTDRQFEGAVEKALRECKYFPLPIELRAFAPGTRGVTESERELLLDQRAQAALLAFEKLVERWGVDRLPEYGAGGKMRRCPEIVGGVKAGLDAAGGWRAFALATTADAPFRRREFLEGYKRFRRLEAIQRQRQLGEPYGPQPLIEGSGG